MADKLNRHQAYFIARQYVQAKPVSWDDLNGTKDLASYLRDDLTESQVIGIAERAYEERVKEDGYRDDIQIKS